MINKKKYKLIWIFKVSERILGTSRSEPRPKSSTITVQNRAMLDIRAIQPPTQAPVIYLLFILFVFVIKLIEFETYC